MMNDKTPNFEVPAEMREFAERSIEQARKAMDGFVSAAMKAADTFEGSSSTAGTSMKDMRHKTFSYAEQNLKAAFDHAQKLVKAKDPAEAMKLQAEFMQSQFAAMQKQMADFGETAKSTMTEAAKSATPKK
jgi:phasin